VHHVLLLGQQRVFAAKLSAFAALSTTFASWEAYGKRHLRKRRRKGCVGDPYALRWTRLSRHSFRHNAVRLQLHALAYKPRQFPAQEVAQWSLTTLREKLVKIGARIVRGVGLRASTKPMWGIPD